MEDNDLGLRFISGAENELEQVINQYGKRLLHYAITIVCDYQEAENIVQDVFIAAYKNRSAFDGQNLSAWLYKITYNKCINQLKKPKPLFFNEIKKQEVTVLAGDNFSEEILIVLSRLKPEERALIYGRIVEGQSYEELAPYLGRSAATLRKKFERAKKKLAKYLSNLNDGREFNHEQI